jgi:hypothetical protein
VKTHALLSQIMELTRGNNFGDIRIIVQGSCAQFEIVAVDCYNRRIYNALDGGYTQPSYDVRLIVKELQ